MQDKTAETKFQLSVQYCKSCDSHNWCTHHNELKYKQAYLDLVDAVKKQLPEVQIIGNQVPTRLVPIKAKENKYYDLVDKKYVLFPAIGAFQVQFCGTLVFSKKNTNAWPNNIQIINEIYFLMKGEHRKSVSGESMMTTTEKFTISEKQQKQTVKMANNVLRNIDQNSILCSKKLKNPMTLTDHFKRYKMKKRSQDDLVSLYAESESSTGSKISKITPEDIRRLHQIWGSKEKLPNFIMNKALIEQKEGKKQMLVNLSSIEEEAELKQIIMNKNQSVKKNKISNLQSDFQNLQNKLKKFENRVSQVNRINSNDLFQSYKKDKNIQKCSRFNLIDRIQEVKTAYNVQKLMKHIKDKKKRKIQDYIHASSQQKNQKLELIYGPQYMKENCANSKINFRPKKKLRKTRKTQQDNNKDSKQDKSSDQSVDDNQCDRTDYEQIQPDSNFDNFQQRRETNSSHSNTFNKNFNSTQSSFKPKPRPIYTREKLSSNSGGFDSFKVFQKQKRQFQSRSLLHKPIQSFQSTKIKNPLRSSDESDLQAATNQQNLQPSDFKSQTSQEISLHNRVEKVYGRKEKINIDKLYSTSTIKLKKSSKKNMRKTQNQNQNKSNNFKAKQEVTTTKMTNSNYSSRQQQQNYKVKNEQHKNKSKINQVAKQQQNQKKQKKNVTKLMHLQTQSQQQDCLQAIKQKQMNYSIIKKQSFSKKSPKKKCSQSSENKKTKIKNNQSVKKNKKLKSNKSKLSRGYRQAGHIEGIEEEGSCAEQASTISKEKQQIDQSQSGGSSASLHQDGSYSGDQQNLQDDVESSEKTQQQKNQQRQNQQQLVQNNKRYSTNHNKISNVKKCTEDKKVKASKKSDPKGQRQGKLGQKQKVKKQLESSELVQRNQDKQQQQLQLKKLVKSEAQDSNKEQKQELELEQKQQQQQQQQQESKDEGQKKNQQFSAEQNNKTILPVIDNSLGSEKQSNCKSQEDSFQKNKNQDLSKNQNQFEISELKDENQIIKHETQNNKIPQPQDSKAEVMQKKLVQTNNVHSQSKPRRTFDIDEDRPEMVDVGTQKNAPKVEKQSQTVNKHRIKDYMEQDQQSQIKENNKQSIKQVRKQVSVDNEHQKQLIPSKQSQKQQQNKINKSISQKSSKQVQNKNKQQENQQLSKYHCLDEQKSKIYEKECKQMNKNYKYEPAHITKQFYGQYYDYKLKQLNHNKNKSQFKGSINEKNNYKSKKTVIFDKDSLQPHLIVDNSNKLANLCKIFNILCARNQFLLIRLVENPHEDRQTEYGVWLCDNFTWKFYQVRLDRASEFQYLTHQNNQHWPLIFVQALCKLFNGFDNLCQASIPQLFHALTGSHYLNFKVKQDLDKNAKLLKFISQNQKKNFIILAQKRLHNSLGQSLEKCDLNVYYVISQRAVNDGEILLRMRKGNSDAFWIKLQKFVTQFSQISILQLRVNHNFSTTPIQNCNSGHFKVIQLNFNEQSFGCVIVATQNPTQIQTQTQTQTQIYRQHQNNDKICLNRKVTDFKIYLYKEQEDNVLRLVGQTSDKNKSMTYFDCCFEQGKYLLFVDSKFSTNKMCYMGQSCPSITLKQQVQQLGLRSNYTEYIPISNIPNTTSKKLDMPKLLNITLKSQNNGVRTIEPIHLKNEDSLNKSKLKSQFVKYLMSS